MLGLEGVLGLERVPGLEGVLGMEGVLGLEGVLARKRQIVSRTNNFLPLFQKINFMKNFRICGSGDILSDILPVANVHMHSRTAKKETKNPQQTYKRFLDLLASYLLQCGSVSPWLS